MVTRLRWAAENGVTLKPFLLELGETLKPVSENTKYKKPSS